MSRDPAAAVCSSRESSGLAIRPSEWTPINTKCFTGRALLRIRGFDEKTQGYFSNRTRLQSVIIQGHFKEAIGASSVQTGQEFKRQVMFPPMMRVLIAMLRRVVTDLRMEIAPDGGFLTLSSVIRTAQRVNISRERLDWGLNDEVKEDTKLLGGYFSECDRDWHMRRKYCSNAQHLANVKFQPNLYFTFEFFNSFVDLTSFELIVSRWRLDLKHYLNNQPVRLMARVLRSPDEPWEQFSDDDILWNFAIHPGQCTAASSLS
jgi:hypothetical protein